MGDDVKFSSWSVMVAIGFTLDQALSRVLAGVPGPKIFKENSLHWVALVRPGTMVMKRERCIY